MSETAQTTTSAQILARSCKMRPISPVEVVNQLVAARKQAIGKSQWDSRDRARKDAAAKLRDYLKLKKIRTLVARAKAAQRAWEAAERALHKQKLMVSSSGVPSWSYYEERRLLDPATGSSRQARLDALQTLKATAYRELLGLDVKQAQVYLRKFQAKLGTV